MKKYGNTKDYLIVEGFIVPKSVYRTFTQVYGLSPLEAMMLILENVWLEKN